MGDPIWLEQLRGEFEEGRREARKREMKTRIFLAAIGVLYLIGIVLAIMSGC